MTPADASAWPVPSSATVPIAPNVQLSVMPRASAPTRYPAPTIAAATSRLLRRRRLRTARAAVTPPMLHTNRAGTSWNTGCTPITAARIMAAVIETRPLKRTVSIIA